MAVARTWLVVGGADKGGIVVREGVDVAAPQASERISTGALVREKELEGVRLHYERLTGTGPATGWVSTKLADGRDLLVLAEGLWEVVGGASSGGILVREGQDTSSQQASQRLSTGALVRELDLQGERLQYKRLTGTGPESGWVSVRLGSGKDILQRVAFDGSGNPGAAKSHVAAAPLEISMCNEEMRFPYDGFPEWVPRAAAVARLLREGKPYLPTGEPPLARLAGLPTLPPFKKIPPKKLREQFHVNLPGHLFGLPFPHTADQMRSEQFGAEWLTKAFHKAGTLPDDNRVTKLTRCEESAFEGFDKEGGAAMKARISVEYLKQDPVLHTNLFAKYTYDPERAKAATTIGGDDSLEVLVAVMQQHRFPFPTPKIYYGDICRETNVFLIIMEAIPYGKHGMESEAQPYEILPGCGKCQDHLLPSPEEYYFCLFRLMGQLAGWDKLGHFDSLLGPTTKFDEQTYLKTTKRQPRGKQELQMLKPVVSKAIDLIIDFFTNWCVNIVPADLRESHTLQKVKDEVLEISPFFGDMSTYYQANNSDYITANHANLQADNAYFWRDEYGDLAGGVLDWGGFSRAPMGSRFIGCLSGADAEMLLGHIEGILQRFVDEYERCGGPKLSHREVLLRYHLALITNMFDSSRWLDGQVYKESTKEEFRSWTGMQDPKFQERFYTRCGSYPAINTWMYYVRAGNLKTVFDDWANGVGKQYMSEFL